MGHSLVVADACESVVIVVVMDFVTLASRAVVGWVDLEAELATECKSEEVVVEAMGCDAAAHTYERVGYMAAEDAG